MLKISIVKSTECLSLCCIYRLFYILFLPFPTQLNLIICIFSLLTLIFCLLIIILIITNVCCCWSSSQDSPLKTGVPAVVAVREHQSWGIIVEGVTYILFDSVATVWTGAHWVDPCSILTTGIRNWWLTYCLMCHTVHNMFEIKYSYQPVEYAAVYSFLLHKHRKPEVLLESSESWKRDVRRFALIILNSSLCNAQ